MSYDLPVGLKVASRKRAVATSCIREACTFTTTWACENKTIYCFLFSVRLCDARQLRPCAACLRSSRHNPVGAGAQPSVSSRAPSGQALRRHTHTPRVGIRERPFHFSTATGRRIEPKSIEVLAPATCVQPRSRAAAQPPRRSWNALVQTSPNRVRQFCATAMGNGTANERKSDHE